MAAMIRIVAFGETLAHVVMATRYRQEYQGLYNELIAMYYIVI